ncbi:MAG TPA: hydrogenase maturation nickel metallochaperone HypA [Cyanobacteria bacterium UBA8543]|nr:hydrogenase maturation nickel metallochaperone HypA [Cyanobacteria bacterium UBA8543]
MHEVGIMQNTLDIALEYAKREGAAQIHRMTLRIGQLSGVEPEALAFAFDVVTRGTIAERAQLNIDSIPAVCYCPNCQHEFQPPDWIYECPECHHFCTEIRQGRELELASLEVS